MVGGGFEEATEVFGRNKGGSREGIDRDGGRGIVFEAGEEPLHGALDGFWGALRWNIAEAALAADEGREEQAGG